MHASSRRAGGAVVILLAGLGLSAIGRMAFGAAGTPASVCASRKTKAAGLRAAAMLRCHAKADRGGVAVAPTCLSGADRKFQTAFSKAEQRGGCETTGDAAAIAAVVDPFTSDVVAAFPDGGTAAGRKCAAAKISATGTRTAGELRCLATGLRTGQPVAPTCLATVGTRFVRAFEKAEARGGCAAARDALDVGASVDTVGAEVVGALTPQPLTTTTIAGNPTTTTTIGATTSTTTAGATTTTTTTLAAVSFSASVQPIFTASCAVSGCHKGASPAEGLNLAVGKAYAGLVNVTSLECTALARVRPGDPSTSYLVLKLTGPPQGCFSGNQMPSGGRSPLSSSQMAVITAWILQGAPNN